MSQIRSVMPVTDDWFVVSRIEGERWEIERVVAWALLEETPTEVTHLRAIVNTGLARDDDDGAIFVKGIDVSPIGRTWFEVFNSINYDASFFHEIIGELRDKLNAR